MSRPHLEPLHTSGDGDDKCPCEETPPCHDFHARANNHRVQEGSLGAGDLGQRFTFVEHLGIPIAPFYSISSSNTYINYQIMQFRLWNKTKHPESSDQLAISYQIKPSEAQNTREPTTTFFEDELKSLGTPTVTNGPHRVLPALLTRLIVSQGTLLAQTVTPRQIFWQHLETFFFWLAG